MKKLFYSILAVAALVSAASCQRETRMDPAAGQPVDVTFELGLQGLQTKAFSDGTSATSLDVLVYNARTDGDVYLPNLTQQKDNAFENLTAQVTLKLVRGENYKIVFWAHAPQCDYALDPENATITIISTTANATGAPAANDELRDAFLGVYEGVITQAVSENVSLKRPFAQINVLTTEEDWNNAINNGVTFSGSSMKVTAPSELNFLTGEVAKEVEQVFAMAPIDEPVNIPGFETGYKYIAMNYILAGATKSLIGEASKPFTFAVYREGQADYLFEHSLVSIPVQRNYRTVIAGEVFCVGADFNVVIEPAFDGTLKPEDNQTPATNEGIKIDGTISDWDNVTDVFQTGKSRIVEWRAASDATNVYFLYKVAKAEIPFSNGYEWAPYIYIGFDTDNDATTGSNGGASLGGGLEAQADLYPWTGSTEGSPEILAGENTKGLGIECPVGTQTGCVTANGMIDGNFCYIEVSVPLAKIGNPTGTITVNHSLSWQTTGAQQITLSGSSTPATPETATITASDVTVEEGKTAAIGASTNSTATITYATGDASIATVDASGTVTGVKAGSTTITLSVAAVDGKFTAASKEIAVTVTAAQQQATEPITIDGSFSDWTTITTAYSSVGNRINSWKYVSTANYLYLYYEVNATKIKTDGSSNFSIGFDMDMDPTTGALGEYGGAGTASSFSITESGLEALATFYPWNGTTAVLSGELSGSSVQCPVGTENGKVTVGGTVSGDVAYLEISIPKSAIGSPAAGKHIIINTAMQYYPTGRTEIVL